MHQTSCVYRPQQNARVERKHRHILEVARSLRFQASLPLNYWGDCVPAAVYLINRTPSSVLNFKTPYEILYDSKPDYKPIRTFGCLAFAYNPDTYTDKFSMRGVPCVFLGYPPNKKGYKLLNLITKQSFVSRDVRFEESIFPFSSNSETPYMNHVPNIIHKPIPDDFDYLTDEPTLSIPNSPDDNEPAEVETVEPIPPPLRRCSRIHIAPKWHADYRSNQTSYISNLAYTQVAPDFQHFVANLTHNYDPIHFKVVVKQEHWIKTMNLELEALEQNGTWEVTELPPNKTAIACKWIYKSKYNPDGTLERHKSRLVVLGCRQKPGIDYDQTFALVEKLTTVRTLLVVASIQNWETCQMDMANAFLHGELQEDAYMKMPQGYFHFGCRITVETELNPKYLNTQLVCRLKK